MNEKEARRLEREEQLARAKAEARQLGAGLRMDIYAERVQFVVDPGVPADSVDMIVIMIEDEE